MSNDWTQTEDLAMNNPLGGIKRDWPEIETAEERIFKGDAKVYVEYFDNTL